MLVFTIVIPAIIASKIRINSIFFITLIIALLYFPLVQSTAKTYSSEFTILIAKFPLKFFLLFDEAIFYLKVDQFIMFFSKKRPEVRDISYDPKSAILKAYTTTKKAEVGILYLGMRLRDYYLEETLIGPKPAYPGTIYYFEKEDEFEIENGYMSVHVKPFYSGFLSKNYEGICYVRCVRIGKSGNTSPQAGAYCPHLLSQHGSQARGKICCR